MYNTLLAMSNSKRLRPAVLTMIIYNLWCKIIC